MKIKLEAGGETFTVDLDRPAEISLPQRFDDNQPRFFAAPPASSRAVEGGGFVGDTQRGGGCNVREIQLVPHCNGTHTESIAHICHDAPMVAEVLNDLLIPSTLVTVEPEAAESAGESYQPHPGSDDLLLTAATLQRALKPSSETFLEALLIRTLPNEIGKAQRDYDRYPAAYFSHEAMDFISALPVKHLIVDLPSVDRSDDGGLLWNHRRYWRVPPPAKVPLADSRVDRTISELAFFPDSIPDGNYLTAIQIPPFRNNAAPSRIFIYALKSA